MLPSDVAVHNATLRVAALMRSIETPTAPVPGLAWSAGETAAHLVGSLRKSSAYLTGRRDPKAELASAGPSASPAERTAIINAQMLNEIEERNPEVLADLLEESSVGFLAATAQAPADRPFLDPSIGVEVPPATSLVVALGELLVHGFDIAMAGRKRWAIPPEEAVLVIDGIVQLAPQYFDRKRASGVRASYELRIRGGRRHILKIAGGSLTVEQADGRVDCWISADPVALLLVIYGRLSIWKPALQGKILAGGRRPWLALRLNRYLTSI